MPEAALVREPLPCRPGTDYHLNRFLETRLGLFGRDLKALEFAVAITFANAKIEPSGRQEIERGGILSK